MILALLFAAALAAPSPEAGGCRFSGEPRAWMGEALRSWDRLDAERLHIAAPVTPTVALFDARCVYQLQPASRGDFRVGRRSYRTSARPHNGQVPLPDGETVPVGRIAFASPVSDGGMFFTMALPPLWRADRAEGRDPARLAMAVFMHEFTHTQQADGVGGRIDRLLTEGLPQDANDDVVQDRFADRPGYRAAWEAERDLFYQAAAAPDAATARATLVSALRALDRRRERYFTGADAIYAAADDVFLTLEGTGNWSAWTWLSDPRGGGLSREDALTFIRGGRDRWSQDEGLGMMLAVDRLTPDWPSRAFGPDAATLDALTARAIQPSRSSE